MQRAQVRSLVPHAATKTWCSQINKEIKSSVWHIVGIRYLEKLLLNVEWKSLMQFTTALWSLERVRPGLRLWLWQCLGGLLPMSESGFHYLKQGSTRMLITHRKLDVAVLGVHPLPSLNLSIPKSTMFHRLRYKIKQIFQERSGFHSYF